MKLIKGTSKGFFGNVLDAARHISQSLEIGSTWHVDWDNTPYNDISKGSNAWEFFFENINSTSTYTEIVSDYTELKLLDGLNFRQTMNYILTRHISVNTNTQHIIDDITTKFCIGKTSLGVHIRKTDKNIGYMFGEPTCAIPLDVHTYIKYIDLHLPTYDKIYIASDDIDDLETITAHVSKYYPGKKIVYLDAIRSKGSISIHNNFPDISGYRKGLEVLIDCCMLSRCGHLIRSTSNVGSTAQFLNLNLTHTNVNEIELGDFREQEYNLYSI